MAILFDWYENPKPSDKEQGEKTLHPRLKYNGCLLYTSIVVVQAS